LRNKWRLGKVEQFKMCGEGTQEKVFSFEIQADRYEDSITDQLNSENINEEDNITSRRR